MNPTPMDLLVDRLDNLPTLPGVALRYSEAVKDDNANLDELGRSFLLTRRCPGRSWA